MNTTQKLQCHNLTPVPAPHGTVTSHHKATSCNGAMLVPEFMSRRWATPDTDPRYQRRKEAFTSPAVLKHTTFRPRQRSSSELLIQSLI
eukprot:299597-Chlamydomonas_euryale.AAC.4